MSSRVTKSGSMKEKTTRNLCVRLKAIESFMVPESLCVSSEGWNGSLTNSSNFSLNRFRNSGRRLTSLEYARIKLLLSTILITTVEALHKFVHIGSRNSHPVLRFRNSLQMILVHFRSPRLDEIAFQKMLKFCLLIYGPVPNFFYQIRECHAHCNNSNKI